MRTAQRDAAGATVFGAFITDAASGTGVAQPGAVPFTYTRTATGTYAFNFDTRLRALFATATADNNGRVIMVGGLGQGTMTAIRVLGTTGAAENGGLQFQCTALDKRQ